MNKIKSFRWIFSPVIFISAIATAIAEPSQPSTRLATVVHQEMATLTGEAQPPATPLTLWYRQPARTWNEALPVGNGKLGAMIFGGVAREQIALNEDSVWEGYKRDADNTNALAALPKVRELLFADKGDEAVNLIGDTMMGVPSRLRSYQPLGDLWIDSPTPIAGAQNYRRDLDLNTGIATTTYQIGDDIFTREVFASYPDNVIVVRMTCNHPHKINLQLAMSRPLDATSSVDMKNSEALKLILHGQIMAQYFTDPKPVPAEKFESQALVIPTGGDTSIGHIGSTNAADQIIISDADGVTLLVVGATDHWGGDPAKICAANLKAASKKSFAELRQRHIADFQKLFKRVDLDLGSNADGGKIADRRTHQKFLRHE